MNGYYIRHLAIGDLATRASEFIKNPKIKQAVQENPEYYLQVLALVQERLKTLAEVEELIELFYEDPQYEVDLLVAKKSDHDRARRGVTAALSAVKALKAITLEQTELALRTAARDAELKDGEVLWTVRVALSGREASPGVFELIQVLGQAETVKRLTAVQKKFG
jgi:glutamyl-tRNA synthetase